MFYYQISELILESQYELQSFSAFICEKNKADMFLSETTDQPLPGEDQISGSVVHRSQPDGWFFHSVYSDQSGLFVNKDYTDLKLLGEKGKIVKGMLEWYVRIAIECFLARRAVSNQYSLY